jgi:hypothetical protein
MTTPVQGEGKRNDKSMRCLLTLLTTACAGAFLSRRGSQPATLQ